MKESNKCKFARDMKRNPTFRLKIVFKGLEMSYLSECYGAEMVYSISKHT